MHQMMKLRKLVCQAKKVEYINAAQNAGVKLVGQFSRETVLSLKSEMPFALWRTIKRAFKVETGTDVFGSEKSFCVLTVSEHSHIYRVMS